MAEVECYYQEEAASPGISWYVDNQFIRRDELEIQQGQLSTISLPLNNLDSEAIRLKLDWMTTLWPLITRVGLCLIVPLSFACFVLKEVRANR